MLSDGESNDAGFPAELMIWLTPAFPIGSFAYSQGLERAVEANLVNDEPSLHNWLGGLLCHGALKTDLQVLALAHRAKNDTARTEVNELAIALQPSRERWDETRVQGQAFWDAYACAWGTDDDFSLPVSPPALPVAVGLAAKQRNISLLATLEAYAVAFLTNLVSAAIRLGTIGQFDGQRVLAKLTPTMRPVCEQAYTATIDDIGGMTFMVDLASIQHETQTTRLFRS